MSYGFQVLWLAPKELFDLSLFRVSLLCSHIRVSFLPLMRGLVP